MNGRRFQRGRSIPRLPIPILAAVLLAAWGCSDDTTAPGGGGGGGGSGGDTLAVADIGAAGGILRTDDGSVVVTFHAGAVPDKTTRFALLPATDPPADPGYVDGTAVTLVPAGTGFQDSVVMTMTCDPAAVPADVPPATLLLNRAAGGAWEPVAGSTVDPGAPRVSAVLDSTGTFGAVGVAIGDSVYQGNYEIRDQATYAAFLPYTGITGNLEIGQQMTGTVTLPALRWIGGELDIYRCPVDTVALSAVGRIDGRLFLAECPHHVVLLLPQCRALGHITVMDDHEQADLDFLAAVRSLNPAGLPYLGGIGLVDLPALTSVASLAGIHGRVRGLLLEDLPAVPSLAGLGGITDVDGDLEIDNVGGLDGLHLRTIGGACLIRNNAHLPSLQSLQSLAWIGGWLQVEDNRGLANLSGLENVGHVIGIKIRHNQDLTSTTGLPPVAALDALIVRDNPALTDLAGLEHLQTIGDESHGNLEIGGNPVLEHLDQLSHLTHIGHNLEITANERLRDLDGLANLDHAWGTIEISNNGLLGDVSALLGLQPNPATGYVCGSFIAQGNCSIMNSHCLSDAAFWEIVDDFGGEQMVEYTVTISGNNSIGKAGTPRWH